MQMPSLSKNLAISIYDYLVDKCEANPRFSDDFVHAFTNNEYVPREWRFCGKYGMAGKFWWNNDKFYVSGWSRCEVSPKEYEVQEKELGPINNDMTGFYKIYLYESMSEEDRRFGQPHYGHNEEESE